MSQFKLPNQIFTLGMDAQEITVYAYLYREPSCGDHSCGNDRGSAASIGRTL